MNDRMDGRIVDRMSDDIPGDDVLAGSLGTPFGATDEGPGELPTEAPGAPTDPPPLPSGEPGLPGTGILATPVAGAAEIVTEAGTPNVPGAPVDVPAAPLADADALAATEAAARAREATKAEVAFVAAVASARAAEAIAAARAGEPADTATDVPIAHPRRRALRAAGGMFVRGVLMLALFVGGIALGNAAFLRSDQNTANATAPIVDPAIDGSQPPAIVQEFITALASGDADSLRSSLQAEPHARLTGEFRRFDIQSITAVDTLGTHLDGTRSATEVVMQGTTTEGNPISINLIILADGNTIEGFR